MTQERFQSNRWAVTARELRSVLGFPRIVEGRKRATLRSYLRFKGVPFHENDATAILRDLARLAKIVEVANSRD